jgi:4-hydroxy-3-methylbut-2-enyl diphosphate reductase
VEIIRASHLGMCFGVRDAIALALDQSQARPLTILGDLVHNPGVVADLRARGIATAAAITQVRTQTVMVTAHGASDRTLSSARALGLEVVEATCPLVRVAHRAIKKLVRDGYHPIIIGQRGHVEVKGLTDDLKEFQVVLGEDDVQRLDGYPRMGIAAQTTQPIERVRRLVSEIERRFPQSEVRFIDTVCEPTKQRQSAAVRLALHSDVVIVIGGADSNNTRELVTTCSRYCSLVHHVGTESDLRAEWFDADSTVGITAGTSTPDPVIDGIERRIRQLARLKACATSDAAAESEAATEQGRGDGAPCAGGHR